MPYSSVRCEILRALKKSRDQHLFHERRTTEDMCEEDDEKKKKKKREKEGRRKSQSGVTIELKKKKNNNNIDTDLFPAQVLHLPWPGVRRTSGRSGFLQRRCRAK